MRKADQKRREQVLTAPVSGVAPEVSAATIGQAPERGAKPLTAIVPDGEALVVEALLLNRDGNTVTRYLFTTL